ncbi:MAG: lipoyl synthase, partial [Actinobacteria bacterium HGW-Actinobacteria-10]
DSSVEVLTSDFAGRMESVDTVAAASPCIYNHNLETVPALYPEVRPGADYRRSLRVLARVRDTHPTLPAKSGLMLGLGESQEQVIEVMRDLRDVGVTMLTLGQYLRPSPDHLPVAKFVEPGIFRSLAREAKRLGFAHVASAPFVRSSYHAEMMVAGADA